MRIHRLAVAAGAVLLSLSGISTGARAQNFNTPIRADADACDGSIRSAQSQRARGNAVARAGLLATLSSIPIMLSAVPANPRTHVNRTRAEIGHYLGMIGIAAQFSGGFFSGRSSTSSAEWDDALQHLTIGRATVADVETCLGTPASRTSHVVNSGAQSAAANETSWEYRARTRSSYFGRSMSRVVTIAFRDSVVSAIKVTESR